MMKLQILELIFNETKNDILKIVRKSNRLICKNTLRDTLRVILTNTSQIIIIVYFKHTILHKLI